MLKHSASIPAPVNLGNAWICRLSKITLSVSSSFCMHGQDNQHKVLAGLPNRPPAPFDEIPKVPFAIALNRLPRNCFLVFASCARFPWRTAAHRFNLFALSEHALCRSLALKLCKRHSETNHPYRAYTRKSGKSAAFLAPSQQTFQSSAEAFPCTPYALKRSFPYQRLIPRQGYASALRLYNILSGTAEAEATTLLRTIPSP